MGRRKFSGEDWELSLGPIEFGTSLRLLGGDGDDVGAQGLMARSRLEIEIWALSEER